MTSIGFEAVGITLAALGGGLVVWWMLATRARQAAAFGVERLRNRDEQIQELHQTLREQQRELTVLREQTQEQVERRSAAEARAQRVDQLEEEAARRQEQLELAQRERGDLLAQIAKLQTRMEDERESLQQQIRLLSEARESLSQNFEVLSSKALAQSNRSFLDLARETLERYQTQAQSDLQGRQKAVEHLVNPIRESLGKVDEQLRLLESARQEAYVGLRQQITDLTSSQSGLRAETQRLSQALRSPNVRGRWGEIQLRRVVEIAGMVPHCDFIEQAQVSGEDGILRPDLIVLLPGGKTVVVDAKAPLKGYLEAMDAPDEETRQLQMKAHAAQLRQHMVKLGAKRYTEQLDSAPEFVVLFLPGESFFSAALEQDPVLIEDGVQNGVILATPTTLIALLRAVSYGWRQETLAEGAQMISQLGREMYDRLRTLTTHFDKMGRGLQSAVMSYNRAVGSYQSRVLVTARRFEELGVPTGKEIAALDPIDMAPRTVDEMDEDYALEDDASENDLLEASLLDSSD